MHRSAVQASSVAVKRIWHEGLEDLYDAKKACQTEHLQALTPKHSPSCMHVLGSAGLVMQVPMAMCRSRRQSANQGLLIRSKKQVLFTVFEEAWTRSAGRGVWQLAAMTDAR